MPQLELWVAGGGKEEMVNITHCASDGRRGLGKEARWGLPRAAEHPLPEVMPLSSMARIQ